MNCVTTNNETNNSIKKDKIIDIVYYRNDLVNEKKYFNKNIFFIWIGAFSIELNALGQNGLFYHC